MMLSKSNDATEPCLRCDAGTLKVLNKYASETRCVGVRFRMSNFCSRCECGNMADRLAKMQCRFGDFQESLGIDAGCCNKTEVCIGIPLSTYGSIDRAVQASRVASKGSDFRAHGSFIAHVSLIKAPEMVKIAMTRWIPFAMNKAYSGNAHVVIPEEETSGVSGKYSDFRSTFVLENKFQSRITPVIKRLRKLRDDEILTREGSMLMRKTQSCLRSEVLKLMDSMNTDDVFKLGLVELVQQYSSAPLPAIEEHEEYAQEVCQHFDEQILKYEEKFSEYQVEMQGRVDEVTEKFDKLKGMYESLLKQRIAEVVPDAVSHVSHDDSLLLNNDAAASFCPRYERSVLLAAMPPSNNDTIVLEDGTRVSAMDKKERREYRVKNRN